ILAESLVAVLTREPGGTPAGEQIRSILLDPAHPDLDPRTETLLLLAARAEHVATVIGPALSAGRDVVCDRFSGSTIAYQGYGRGLDLDEVRRVCDLASGGLWPDLVVLLDVPADEARARRGQEGGRRDRMEDEDDGFHDRVAKGFAELARAEPDRWVIVDGLGSVDAVAARVLHAYEERLGG
ncbi:MAG: dTMP kinase, partial [Actinobacteria bacterium]|nr:dTMP kinase [Actinomycetota bacterium]